MEKEIDFKSMLERMQMLSKLMGKENNDLDMKKVLKLFEVMKVMGDINNSRVKENTEYFDDDLSDGNMKTMKAILPYLDDKYQKNIGFIIKIMEIQNLFKKYNNTVASIKKVDSENWQKNILLAIRPHMEERKREQLDIILQVFEFKEMMTKLQKLDSIGGGA